MRMSSPEDVPAMRPMMRGAALAEPVIATKLFVPALGTRSVQRPRLRNALEKARNARLTLVVAPAGWGKSTLLAQWLCDGGCAVRMAVVGRRRRRRHPVLAV